MGFGCFFWGSGATKSLSLFLLCPYAFTVALRNKQRMITIEKAEFRPLRELPLRWRWTDSRWSVLPDDALESIQPLIETTARRLCQHSLTFLNHLGVNEEFFESIKRINTSGETSEIGKWLSNCSSDVNQTVIVSWNDREAVLIRWDAFCRFWDDFCYPSSDDVAVFPLSEEWMLFSVHDETFVFGKRQNEPISQAQIEDRNLS